MLTLLKVPQQRNTVPIFQGTVSCFIIKCSSAHLLLLSTLTHCRYFSLYYIAPAESITSRRACP